MTTPIHTPWRATRRGLSRRRLAAGATAAIAALSLAACTSGQETADAPVEGGNATGPIQIAYIQKQGDQQYFVDQANGAKEAAQALGDVEVNVVDVGNDSNQAISEVDAAVAQGAKGIIIVVPDQQIGPQVINAAKAAGVPLMASDDVIEGSDGAAAPFVGFNGTAMGTEVGTEAARLYTEAGWTPENTKILSAYKLDLTVCQERVEGAATAFAEAVGADVPEVIDVGTDNSVTDAQNKAGAVITGNPDVENWVVWGCNDENETGVVTALQNSGVEPANIIGVGLGAYLACKDWAAGQDTGNKAALFISGAEVGKSAVETMVAFLRDGTALPPETIADTTIVDASSWEEAGVVCT